MMNNTKVLIGVWLMFSVLFGGSYLIYEVIPDPHWVQFPFIISFVLLFVFGFITFICGADDL